MTMTRGRSAHRPPGSPTDLELMQYFDGELPEPRRSAVAAFLNADLAAQSKVAGLRFTASILRDEAETLSAADGIADAVMAKIAAEPRPIQVQPTSALPHVAPLPMIAKPAAPANDNSRRIFAALGAIAVAAAAALALWTRAGAPPNPPERSSPIAAVTTPSTLPTPAPSEPEVDAALVPSEAEPEHGVEVAAVNFGSHMGSIFYVPSGSIEAKRTTTVVWLADDAGE